MIQINLEQMCSGCEACANICPQKCITMKENTEGFRYPIVDTDRCTDCSLCERVCPYLDMTVKGDIMKSPLIYVARSTNDNVLRTSASGGIFYELARKTIEKGGVVFGAVWGENVDEVYHKGIDNIDDLALMQGSKYLQSQISQSYAEAKNILSKGRYVLFSGTPCQIAGLLSFLKRDYDNLLTCDLICHGVPSPMVLKKWLFDKEKKAGKKIVRYYRDKKYGWKPAGYTIVFEDGKTEKCMGDDNIYSKMFTYYNILQRNSCYACRFTRSPRVADISLGDYFVKKNALDTKGEEVFVRDNKGMSLITINTRQGISWFNEIMSNLHYVKLLNYSVTSWHLFEGPGNAANPKPRQFLFSLIKFGKTVEETYNILYGRGCKWKKRYYKFVLKLKRWIRL